MTTINRILKGGFLFFILLGACSPVNRRNRIKHTFEVANQKLSDSYYDDAIVLYSKVIDMDHEMHDAYMNRGVAYFETGHYTAALADYNHVYQVKPEFDEILFNRVYAYMAMERFDMAQEDIQVLKNIYPDTSLVYMIEGLWHGEQLNYASGVESFSEALLRDANNFDAFVNRGIMQYHLGELEAAESDLIAALAINQNAPVALNPLSLVYLDQGLLAKADSVIDVAISMFPDQPYFLNNKGLIQIHLGNYDLADSFIQASLKLDSENPSAQKNLVLLGEKRKLR